MISDFNSTTRYRRRKETEKALQFIHGGATSSYYGAWDYIAENSPKELIDEFVSGYKRGKYLQETLGKAMKEFQSSPESIKHAVAMKYQNFLSCTASACILNPVFHPTVTLSAIAVVAERRRTTLIVVPIALRVWKLFCVHKTNNCLQRSLTF